jgi:Ca-activated chloride channel family protein
VLWARGQLRQLEDRYAIGAQDVAALERRIVATSLAHGVLCRFTAFVAVDRSSQVTHTGPLHRVTQPVELPRGWASGAAAMAPMAAPPPMMALGGAPGEAKKRARTGAFAPVVRAEAAAAGGPATPSLLRRLQGQAMSKGQLPPQVAEQEGALPPLDVSAYRRRAAQLAEALTRAPGAEGLAALGAGLAVLVEDVQSTAPGLAALAGLKALLEAVRSALSGTPGAQEVEALVQRARAELEAFAQGREEGGTPPPTGGRRKQAFWR